MANGSLKRKHLAELHELAAERGIDGYRMLTRAELIAELGGGEEAENGGREAKAKDKDRDGARGKDRGKDREEEAGEQVSGILDITPRGHGFIRREGLEAAEGDVYVSPSQIRRCELERGDLLTGPARQPRRGERHPAMVHIDTVNGVEPGSERRAFEELEAVPPTRRLPLTGEGAGEDEALLLRAVDLLVPLARGQRVLVNASRGSGRTTFLRAVARELSAVEDLEVSVVLVDERPEEESAWREAVPEAELSIAGAEMRPADQLRVAELAVARAKRRAERGDDVVLIIDSLSRLAVAGDDPGVSKPIFAAGRETAEEDSGSLTVIATTLTGPGAGDDGGVAAALATTENATITLSAELAEAGVYPALDVGACRITGEESLREGPELAGARGLRVELAALPARDAAERLRERVGAAPTNESLLASLV